MFIERSGNVTSLSDRELLDQFRANQSLEVLAMLYDRYMHLVYGVCIKYLKDPEDSKDAVMGIFEKLITELKKHEVQNFKSWLHVTTRNYCLMKLRTPQYRNQRDKIDINSHEDMDYQVPAHHEEEDLESNLEVLKQCIEELNQEQQTSVKLFFLDQRCYREITEITGFPLKKVKSYIQNGKRNLKLCVEKSRERT